MVYSVIGSNYGDEGKGLAVDYLSLKSKKTLVVRHNGGAQSGHTVEIEDKRFVFHELSSGTFRMADTYWAETFLPDLYKLSDEMESFQNLTGYIPRIFASLKSCITTIDDVLVNMLLESSRGDKRHGSCGMGINEADIRNRAGYEIKMKDLFCMDVNSLTETLKEIRESYTIPHLIELGLIHHSENEYYEMLFDDSVIINFANQVMECRKYITDLIEPKELFSRYENIIFENGQGLRLDSEFEENWPHVTASRTGLTNVISILNEAGMKLDEALYVTRSYITKHGAGLIENEDSQLADMLRDVDQTNVPNEWQGSLRYLRYDNADEFLRVINMDKRNCKYPITTSLMITHLNETDQKMLFQDESIPVTKLIEQDKMKAEFDKFYLSNTKFAKDIRMFSVP